MLTLLRRGLLLLLAAALIAYAAWIQWRPASFFLSDLRSSLAFSQGDDRGRGNLLGIQPELFAADYQSLFGGLAETYGVTIVAGSIVLPEPRVEEGVLLVGDGPLYNVSLVFDRTGQPLGQPQRHAFEAGTLTTAAADTLQVLTLAYMDQAALEETIDSGEATFFSRSRGGRWRKGETSGDRLHVVAITPDCDCDALVLSVRPVGNACHLNRVSCFGEADAPGLGRIARLEKTIRERASADPGESWTAKLLQQGPKRIAQKVGEEGVETALAGVAGPDAELASEAADLIFHLLVLLHARNMVFQDVLDVLAQRAEAGKGAG